MRVSFCACSSPLRALEHEHNADIHPSLFLFTADSTGSHSLYTTYKDYELMFHVSTLLPYTLNNKQQVSNRVGGVG